jgi:hypothetical protein
MADARLVPCLKALRVEIDTLAPHRDRSADGDVGDKAHQAKSSSHNPDDTPGLKTPFTDSDNIPEIHALDIDATGPWPTGRDLNWIVETIRGRHLRGFDNRLQNIIWRDRVASRSWGWTWEVRAEIGHYDHAHFESTYQSNAEADERPWGLLEQLHNGRPLVMEHLDGYALPILKIGDSDDNMSGWNLISRVQAVLTWLGKYTGQVDGDYGPKTVTAIRALGLNDGRLIDRAVWTKLYGLSKI